MTDETRTGFQAPGDSSGQMAKEERDHWINLVLSQYCDVYFVLDAKGRFTEIRGKFSEIFQKPAEDSLGSVIWDLFPLKESALHQKTQEAAQTGQPTQISGALLPGESWLEVRIQPTRRGLEFFVRDIADYHQEHSEQTGAIKSQVLFDALLENIPEGNIIADKAKGSVLIVSKYGAENLGFELSEILQRPYTEVFARVRFLSPDSGAEIPLENHPLTRVLENGDWSEDDTLILRNTRDEEFAISAKYGPICNEEGEVIAGIFSWMNINERRQAEMALEETTQRLASSNQALESFASSASHDLQEPLRKILGFSDILYKMHGENLEEDAKDLLLRIRGASLRMQNLINNLLSFSRISAKPPEMSMVDLNQVLQEVLSDLEITIQQTGAQLEISHLPVLLADAAQLEHLFLNLLGNAIKFRRKEVTPLVRVCTVEDNSPGWVRIAVEDNGVGFEMSQVERIFQPFQRLHGRSMYEGTGLGLAICQKIVELHGGRISAHSIPGQGSTFWIDFPLNEGLREQPAQE